MALLAAVAIVVVIVSAGTSVAPRNAAPSPSALTAAFRGSPAVLAALHAQGSRLLGGGPAAFKARLAQLRGYPVVINKWASWCVPCQTEFPAYQRASVAYGRQVAFVGIDGKDDDGAAAAFLRRFPLSYPSYVDPQENIARAVQAAIYYPQTVYLDRQGHEVYDHAGPYLTAAALEQDIRRYALR